jgi:hypothetical protein
VTHKTIATILLVVGAILLVIEWLLHMAKREALRLDLVGWACFIVAVAFLAP